ncbi:MAG: S-layer homology domain-containing protein, partial [Clostridia bacterium]|nr:S-layer homology domain-containing protein [Clostridia bacterium]
GSKVSFKDEGKISTWAKDGVKDAVAYGLINGYADGTYRPANLITRAEAAQILFRICELTTKFNIYVDPKTGNDKNNGTKEAPLATVHAARDMARKYNDDMQNNINIRVKGKVVLKDTLNLTTEDSGTNGFNIIYTSWGDEKATFSMGADYTGFKLHDAEKNIYKVYVGKGTVAAQAYFNGKRGILARTIEGLSQDAELTKTDDGKVYRYFSNDRWLMDLEHPTDVRIRFQCMWNDMWVELAGFEELEDGRIEIIPHKTNWNNPATGSTVGTRVMQWGRDHTRFPEFFENAYEFLDFKGEWYLNKHDGYMYYIPRDGEDMSTMVLTLGEGERLIEVEGKSMFEPAHHIQFKNIKFTETNWLTPITEWHGANSEQNNTPYLMTSTTLRHHYPAAIELYNAWYVDFYDNEFSNLGAAGLFYEDRVKHGDIVGNEFKDIAAGPLIVGTVFIDSLDGTPQAESRGYNECFNISNNYIHDTSADYMGGAGLTLGYVRNVDVSNNFISNTPYSGMHIGWGWDSRAKFGTIMENVMIHHNFVNEVQVDRIYDGGPIYTLGASRLPMTETRNEIYENYIKSNRNLGPTLYHDQGSSSWSDHDNVLDHSAVQMVEANFADNGYYWTPERFGIVAWANGTSGGGNSADNNYVTVSIGQEEYENPIPSNHVGVTNKYPDADWPQEALDIIANAGISDEYKDNFDLEGPLYLVSERRLYDVHLGTTVDLELAVTDIDGKKYNVHDYNINYVVNDPSVATVSKDLKVTGLKEGQTDVYLTAEVNGITQKKTLRIKVVPEIDTVEARPSYISMFPGGVGKIQIYSKDVNGKLHYLSRRYAEFSSNDTSIATVSKDGIVIARNGGSTTINVKLSYCGKVVEQEVKFATISYVYDDTLERPYRLAGNEILSPSSWNNAKAVGGGVSVEGMPQLTKEPIESGLIAFDMIIRNPNGWPSLTFGGQKPDGSYNTDNVYLIGFKSDQLEFQRFNEGVRTMIFGDLGNQGKGIAGPGRPNLPEDPFWEYNKRVSVIAGAMEDENGTRVVVIVNGEPVIDYVDADENRVPASGYFGVYNNNGGTFEFYPYTGITNK